MLRLSLIRTAILALLCASVQASPTLRASPGAISLAEIYRLTDTQQFDLAVSRAAKLVTAEPASPGARLAYAYALRHSGAQSAALREYQTAALLESTNADAITGQVLMLQAIGAPVAAQRLAQQHSLTLPEGTRRSLQHAQAVQELRLAGADPAPSAAGLAALDNAVETLRGLVTKDPQYEPDLVAGLSRQGAHTEALTRYESLVLRNAAPEWLLPDAANSYTALHRYTEATALYERAYRRSPLAPEAWTALFYSYSDQGLATEAQALMDEVVLNCPAATCRTRPRALALQAYSRLWAAQPEAAQALTFEGIVAYPNDVGLKAAHVAALASAGHKTTAREQLSVWVAQDQGTLEFRLAGLTLSRQPGDLAGYERALSDLERSFPVNSQVARARQDWDRSLAPTVQLRASVEVADGARTSTLGTTVRSGALTPSDLRLVAQTDTATFDLPNAAPGQFSSYAVGLDLPLSFATELRVRATVAQANKGATVELRHAATEALALEARVALNDARVPLKALERHTRINSGEVSGTYRLNASTELGGAGYVRTLSDADPLFDNRQTGFSARYTRAGTLRPNWTSRSSGQLGRDTSTNQAGAYFSPSSSFWVEAEYAVERRQWVRNDEFLTVKPHASFGFVSQANFGAMPFATLGVGLTYSVGQEGVVELKLGVSRKPYDGRFSSAATAALSAHWSLF